MSARPLPALLVAMLTGCGEDAPEVTLGELVSVAEACRPADPAEIASSRGREGLAAQACPTPDGRTLMLLTDDNITWPVIEGGDQPISLEDAVLATPPPGELGYIALDPQADRIAWAARGDDTVGAAFSLSAQDTVTLETRRIWGLVRLGDDPAFLGYAEEADGLGEAFAGEGG